MVLLSPKKFNKNEKYIANIMTVIVTFVGFLLSLISTYVTSPYKTYILFGFVVLVAIILSTFKEKIFLFIINNLSPEKTLINLEKGKWLLKIQYEEECNGQSINRSISGTCKIQHSLAGVKIFGDKLIDQDSKITKKDTWIAESAEMVFQDNENILIYLYKIPSDSNKSGSIVYEKVGIVVANRSEDNGEVVYSGTFRDLPLTGEQVIREGTVVLIPTKD